MGLGLGLGLGSGSTGRLGIWQHLHVALGVGQVLCRSEHGAAAHALHDEGERRVGLARVRVKVRG